MFYIHFFHLVVEIILINDAKRHNIQNKKMKNNFVKRKVNFETLTICEEACICPFFLVSKF